MFEAMLLRATMAARSADAEIDLRYAKNPISKILS